MSVRPPEILSIAKALLADTSAAGREARGRAIVSRAYYAVFHEAGLLADELGAPEINVKGGVHEKLHAKLESLVDASPQPEKAFLLKAIGGVETLRDWRVEADYTIDEHFSAERPVQAVERAERTLRQLLAARPGKKAPSSVA